MCAIPSEIARWTILASASLPDKGSESTSEGQQVLPDSGRREAMPSIMIKQNESNDIVSIRTPPLAGHVLERLANADHGLMLSAEAAE